MFLTALVFLLALCRAQKITNLPGLEFKVNFGHYSGFLNVSKTHYLHYWFVESQNDPEREPLIFWFNGGPGCSSLAGLLVEMGPYLVNPDGESLRRNPYSWNTEASVVYVESPAGVGYSYATDGNITTSDDQTSLENYEAVKEFLKRFPRFRRHNIFIMGESYGGVYAPTLTARIIEGQEDFPISLKGMALGNGYVNKDINFNTAVRYGYGYGLLGEEVWSTIKAECCKGCMGSCDFSKVSGLCIETIIDVFKALWSNGLNPYDIYGDCDPTPSNNSARLTQILKGVAPFFDSFELRRKNEDFMNFLPTNEQLFGGAPCINDTNIITYMNDYRVRAALNISTRLNKWFMCSDEVPNTYQKQYRDMSPFMKKIIEANIRVLMYYGDTDMACNFMMGQQFSYLLGLKRLTGKKPWKFNGRIAGFKTLFSGLTFITVKGAGHMTTEWKAPEMQYIIRQFLNNNTI